MAVDRDQAMRFPRHCILVQDEAGSLRFHAEVVHAESSDTIGSETGRSPGIRNGETIKRTS
jgi:hypothetical protein